CAILDNGDLKCWGSDDYGQLGDGGSNTNLNAPSSTAINLGSGRTAVAVSAGQAYTCAILDNGDLKCWGSDGFGRLGDGGSNTNTNAPSSTAINLGSGRTAVAVSAGVYYACAILDNGDLKCWGYDSNGQLGDGGSNTATNAPSSTAINLGSGRTAVAVSAGYEHTCAILDNGDLKCWGLDNYGQLGDGGSNTNTNAPPSTAINLGSGRTAVAVSAGYSHTCAILDNGDLKCWGYDGYGELGDGGGNTNTNAPPSTAINLGSGRTAVAVYAGYFHTCAILDNGDLKCWGSDAKGQLGDGGTNTNTDAPSSTAINLGTGRTAVAVSAGDAFTCAILDNGEAKCWGWDSDGQLGDGGSNTNQGSPVAVSGSNTWDSSTGLSSGSGGGMTNVTGATCTVSPS
ncbi:MAG: RCC1 repeat-containing protein, partial [Flavobacteriia bacterium]|nr:RCC1 repeat-containing protein [Flavobacteriia bacterium]